MEQIKVRVEGGYFIATPNEDPNYPGIDVEFVADNDNGENLSRPRVMFEKPLDDNLQVLIWENPRDLMPTTEIYFEESQEE